MSNKIMQEIMDVKNEMVKRLEEMADGDSRRYWMDSLRYQAVDTTLTGITS